MYKLKIILRYLLRRRITMLPILAVGVAVFLLVVVLAVMRGFAGFIEDKLRGTLADVIVESNDVRGFDGWEAIAAKLRRIDGVEAVSPHLSGKGALTLYAGAFRQPFDYPCLFTGIDPKEESAVTRLDRYFSEGTGFTAKGLFDEGLPGVIIGSEIFGQYTANVHIGYPVTLTTPTAFDETSSKDFLVTAKFKTGLYEHDRTTVYVPLAVAQKMLGLEGRVTSLHLRAKPGADLGQIKSAAVPALPDAKKFVVETWMESQKVLIDAMALERIIWVVVLSALLAVAGFCILAVMSLTVIQKRRDVGILRAVGASARGILSAFLQYGLAVGLIGATLGLVGALLVLHHLDAIEGFTKDAGIGLYYLWAIGAIVMTVLAAVFARPEARKGVKIVLGAILATAAVVLLACLVYGGAVVAGFQQAIASKGFALPAGLLAAGIISGVLLLLRVVRPRSLSRTVFVLLALVLWSATLMILTDAGRVQLQLIYAVGTGDEVQAATGPAGQALGSILAFGREHLSWTPWPRDVFYFERIPVEMNAWAFFTFWAWGVAVACAASLYPAARAARTDPVSTLRMEH